MEKWRRVWRQGFLPALATEHLELVAGALDRDDPCILQGASCRPAMSEELADAPVEATCVLGHGVWRSEACVTVGQMDVFVQELCNRADACFSEPAACRHFLNWYDDTPRAEMRRALLAEVRLALQQRAVTVA